MLPDSRTEAGTERDGVLSYAGEWHALVVGFAVGFAAAVTGRWELAGVLAAAALGVEGGKRSGKAFGEVRSEPWYALGGLVVGVPIGVAVGWHW